MKELLLGCVCYGEREIFIYNGNKLGEVEKLHLILILGEDSPFPCPLTQPGLGTDDVPRSVGAQNSRAKLPGGGGCAKPEESHLNRSPGRKTGAVQRCGRKSRGKTGRQPLLQCHASQRVGSRAERARARGGGGDPRQRFPATGKPPRVQVGSPARLRELPRAGADLLVGSATVMTSAMMSAPLNGLFH
jgi:hypothetical protein